jgi:hypothetical protein
MLKNDGNDETKLFIDGHYLSPPKGKLALARLLNAAIEHYLHFFSSEQPCGGSLNFRSLPGHPQ